MGRIPASRVRIPPSPSRVPGLDPCGRRGRSCRWPGSGRKAVHGATVLSTYADPATSQKREDGAVTCFLASSEGWQSGRMRRSRKPFRAVRSDEGSNPSPSACSQGVGASSGCLPARSSLRSQRHRLVVASPAGGRARCGAACRTDSFSTRRARSPPIAAFIRDFALPDSHQGQARPSSRPRTSRERPLDPSRSAGP